MADSPIPEWWEIYDIKRVSDDEDKTVPRSRFHLLIGEHQLRRYRCAFSTTTIAESLFTKKVWMSTSKY